MIIPVRFHYYAFTSTTCSVLFLVLICSRRTVNFAVRFQSGGLITYDSFGSEIGFHNAPFHHHSLLHRKIVRVKSAWSILLPPGHMRPETTCRPAILFGNLLLVATNSFICFYSKGCEENYLYLVCYFTQNPTENLSFPGTNCFIYKQQEQIVK